MNRRGGPRAGPDSPYGDCGFQGGPIQGQHHFPHLTPYDRRPFHRRQIEIQNGNSEGAFVIGTVSTEEKAGRQRSWH